MTGLIDSHCHLDAAEFDADRDAVIARARAAGVVAQVVPAVTGDGWEALRALCHGHPDLHPAYGLHPVYLDASCDAWLQALPDWIAREQPCAIGECGLDFFVEGLDRERQRRVFLRHCEVAQRTGLPLVLHALRAVEEVILTLRRFDGLRGVVHSFSGSPEQARQLWEMGFLVGLGGPLTYDRARRLRRLAAEMPLEHLLLETDAPDQPDAQHRGQRNEPARLLAVAETIAALRGVTVDDVAAATTANARRLFALPAAL